MGLQAQAHLAGSVPVPAPGIPSEAQQHGGQRQRQFVELVRLVGLRMGGEPLGKLEGGTDREGRDGDQGHQTQVGPGLAHGRGHRRNGRRKGGRRRGGKFGLHG
jgi:hypothetical protein